MATRSELLLVTGERYQSSSRAERGRILNEFVALTGYHRKHAIRLLARRPVPGSLGATGGLPIAPKSRRHCWRCGTCRIACVQSG